MTLFHPPAPPRQPDDTSALKTLALMRECPLTALRQRSYRMQMGRINLITRMVWLINDTAIVRRMLGDQTGRYPKGVMMSHVLSILVGNSSFISNGETWKRRRRIMDVAFGQAGVRRVFPLMRSAVDDMVARLRTGAAAQVPVDVDVEMAHVTADIIYRTVFSQPLPRDEATRIYKAFQRFQTEMARYGQRAIVRIPRIFSMLLLRRARHAAAEIRGALDPLIRTRLDAVAQGTDDHDDILATMIATADPETGTHFTYDELCEEVATLMLAGHETSSSTLAWSLYLLSHAPAIQARAHAEAIAVLAGRPAEFTGMKALTLIRNVFHEALRLYPPVPFMTRDLTEAEEMRGHKLKAGAIIYVSPWLLHRSERHWKEPEAFDPDRFERDESREAQRAAYLPFSMGPRVCLGAAFAMQEATLILAELVRHFQFDPADTPDPIPQMRLSLRANQPIRLTVSMRDS
ncbi:cytochrome P450 [soil metagenome]